LWTVRATVLLDGWTQENKIFMEKREVIRSYSSGWDEAEEGCLSLPILK